MEYQKSITSFRPLQGLPIMNHDYSNLLNDWAEMSFRPLQGLPIMNIMLAVDKM